MENSGRGLRLLIQHINIRTRTTFRTQNLARSACPRSIMRQSSAADESRRRSFAYRIIERDRRTEQAELRLSNEATQASPLQS